MKNFTVSLILLIVAFPSIGVIGQWEVQHATGLPASQNPTLIFSAVSSDVCWGIQQEIVNPKSVLTTDRGASWILSNVQIPSELMVQSIAAIDFATAYIAVDNLSGSSNGGIYKTINSGMSWLKQDSAFAGSGVHPRTIYFFDADNGLCIGNPRNGYWEIYTTSDGGQDWNRVPLSNIPGATADITFNGISFGSGDSFWFGTCSRDLYRTTNRGITWAVTKDAFAEPSGFCGVDIAFKDPLNGIAATYFGDLINRTYKTTDGGVTWTPLPTPPSFPSFYFLTYDSASGAYVATSHDNIGAPQPTTPGSVFSRDDGLTWNQLDNLIHGSSEFKDGFGWSGGNGDIIFRISSNIIPVELTSFIAQAQNSKVILNWTTATEINNLGFEIQRKFETGDFATVGFVDGEGTTTNQQEYSYTDKNLSDGKYSYRLKQVDFNGNYEYSKEIEVDVRSLDNFTLEQNYPNPFNPTTTIGYVLQDKCSVKLSLINAIGEEIALLVNEEQDKGYHKVELDAKNLSSGVYYYQITAGGFPQTKKLILMK